MLMLSCFSLLFALPAFAQSVSVEGRITDGISGPLSSATILLLNAGDSILVSYASSGKDGNFEIRNVKAGEYLLQVSYLGFSTLFKPLQVEGSEGSVALGDIPLVASATTLETVEITGEHQPLQIRKDTIEYNADAFKPKAHEKVEDLLKRLPGVEVDEDGTVKAQGEEVKQVLVDGKEFFGKDPKVATKNLPADAVNKVQVFDKKSEMAEFSGIDDGLEEKAINLELKADRRKGLFGDVAAGYGSDDRYRSNASINKFNQNEQISLIGGLNNINQQGFSIGDYMNFMGGLDGSFRGGRRSGGGIPINQGLSNGFIQSGALGLNYNLDFNDKVKLRSSYFFNHLDQDIDRLSETDYQFEDDPFITNEDVESNSLNNNHRLSLILSVDPDSNQSIQLATNVGIGASNYSSESLTESIDYQATPLNSATRENVSGSDNLNTDFGLIYRRKLGKPGRIITGSVSYAFAEREQDYGILSLNDYYNVMGEPDSMSMINQDQDLVQNDRYYQIEATYTEPLGRGKFLEFNVERRHERTDLDKDVFDVNNGTREINSSLSQDYTHAYTYDLAGIGFRLNREKLNLSFGADVQRSVLDGKLMSSEQLLTREYTHVLPDLRLRYNIKQGSMLMFDYRTRVNAPSIEQLQPIVDNSDPLNIYIGNPDLDAAFSHSLALRYHGFSQFTMISVFGSVGLTYTENAITNAKTINPDFSQTTMPVNVNKSINARIYGGAGLPLRFIKCRLSINGSVNYSDSYTFVNAEKDETDRYNTNFQARLNNQKREILEWGVGARFGYNVTQYANASYLNQDYTNQEYSADMKVNFLKAWAIGGILRYQVYQSSLDEPIEDVPLLEASLSRDLLGKRLRLEFGVFDILNKNLGIEQSADINYVREARVLSIGRYAMLSARYTLNKLGGGSSPGVHMIRH